MGVPVNVMVQMKDQYGNNRQGNPEWLGASVWFFKADLLDPKRSRFFKVTSFGPISDLFGA